MSKDPAGNAMPNSGTAQHARDLLPLVYDELRRLAGAQIAREKPGHTLDATALVHEAYVRLAGSNSFESRSHFLRVAAEAMRCILIDSARRRTSLKRGGEGRRLELNESDYFHVPEPDRLLAIDEALAAMAVEDSQVAEIARMRLFGGLTLEEIAAALNLSRSAVFRDWSFARANLALALGGGDNFRNS